MAKTNNKYASINFNHIYEKNVHTSSTATAAHKSSPSSAASFASIASSASPNTLYKSHLQNNGRMLVLSRPTPKPITTPLAPQPQQQQPQPPSSPSQPARSEPQADPISLRPLGRTGTGPSIITPLPNPEKEKEVASSVALPKTNKFVPPHLRPGFVAKEEKPGPEVFRGREPGTGNNRQNHQPQHPHPHQHQHQHQHHHPQQHQHHHPQQQGYYGSPGRFGENGRPKSGGYDRMRRGGGDSNLNRPRSSGNRPNSSG